MDRERAEAHLRLLAEEELRRATGRSSDEAARSPPADETVAELYLVHYPALLRVAVSLVRDVRMAEEVVQESFAALLGGGPRLADADRALAYLHQAVVNRSRAVMRARAIPGGKPPQVQPDVSSREHHTQVVRVARVLTAVGALDGEVADRILADFELALALRQPDSPGRRGPGARSWPQSAADRPRPTVLVSSQPSASSPAPGRLVRLGQVIPFHGEGADGEVYLLSYAQTESGPQLSLFMRARRQVDPPGPEIRSLEQFTATDDKGTRYQMAVRNLGSGPEGWTVMLRPSPPHDPQWLDLTTTPGQPAVRVDLNPSARPSQDATVTASTVTASPGEHLLHAVAARLLATAVLDGDLVNRVPLGPGPLIAVADGLGDVIAALCAADALSPLSLVPGQLAALSERLHVTSHGITARPARDLPEPWLSTLAHYLRRKTGAAPARDGCAAAVVVFPEVDGITLAILGLHNWRGRTFVHMHASGPMSHVSHGPGELYYWPVTWIRDSGGHWHATRIWGRSGIDGGTALRMEVIPPLSHATTWIEVVTTGRSAEARARLPLRWE